MSDATPLYVSPPKIHPKAVKGPFRRAKTVISLVLLAVYFVGPWIPWDRGPGAPDQAILFDLQAQRGWIFGAELWPQEIYFLAATLILGVVALFMTASLAGRAWCGFSCPQTVFTDLFVRVERLFEGERATRMRLDKQPMSVNKALRKSGKHAVWLLISLAFGATLTFYFIGSVQGVIDYATLQAGVWSWTFALSFAGVCYLLAGYSREQMCNYMCPWPRIQSAMLDEHSLVVTYQADRGDTRGPKRKSQTWEQRLSAGFGDCIDCNQCVQACPIGIDIRDGVNADCINCGLCIDACDSIMAGIGQPKKLIRFDSYANQAARRDARPEPSRLFRAKSFAYAAFLGILGASLAVTFATRSTLEVTAIKERAPLFVALSDGSIRNDYTLKIANMERDARTLQITVEGPNGASLALLGGGDAVTVAPDEVASVKAFLALPSTGERPDKVTLVVRDAATGLEQREPVAFSWPRG